MHRWSGMDDVGCIDGVGWMDELEWDGWMN